MDEQERIESMINAINAENAATTKKQQASKKDTQEQQTPSFIFESEEENGLLYSKYYITLGNGKKYEALKSKLRFEKIIDTLNVLSKYSTEDSPEITPEELYKVKDEMYKNIEWNNSGKITGGVYVYEASRGYESTMLDNFNTLIEHYSDKDSPEGKTITADELYDLADRLIDWQEITRGEGNKKASSVVIDTIKDNIGYGPYRIDTETQWKIKDEVYKNVKYRCDDTLRDAKIRTDGCVALDNFDKLTELISDEYSEAGECWTIGELENMFDLLEKWQSKESSVI